MQSSISLYKARFMSSILWLKDVEEKHREFLGEKIVKLVECKKAGVDVPNCFIITPAAFYRFIKEAGIGQSLQEDYRNLDEEDVMALDNISKRMQRTIFSAKFPEWLTAELKEAYQRMSMHDDVYELSEKIKSLVSAARGDSKVVVKLVFGDAPFVFSRPVFNVRGLNTLKNAVMRAWMDAFQAENIYMLKKMGANPFKISVVVQEMVNAEKSCRALTFHPTKGTSKFVIEACYGFSVPIFENEFVADFFVISKESGEVEERVVREKRYLYAADPIRTEIRREALNGSLERSATLDDEELKKVHEILDRISSTVDDSCLVDVVFQREKAQVVSVTPLPFLKSGAMSVARHSVESDASGEEERKVRAACLTPWNAEGIVVHVSSEAEVQREELDGSIAFVPHLSRGFVIALHKLNGIVTKAANITSRSVLFASYLKKGVALMEDEITEGTKIIIDPAENSVKLLREREEFSTISMTDAISHADVTEVVPSTSHMEDLITAVKVGVVIPHPNFTIRSAPGGEAFLVSREVMESAMYGESVHFGAGMGFGGESMNGGISSDGGGLVSRLSALLSRIIEDESSLPVWVQLHPVDAGNFLMAELNSVANVIMKGFRNVGVVLPSFLLPHEFETIASAIKNSNIGRVRTNVTVLIDRPASLFMGELLKKASINQVLIDVDALLRSAFQNVRYDAITHLSSHKGFMNMLSAGISHFNSNGFKVMISGRAVESVDVIRLLVDHGVDCIFVERDKLKHVKYLVARYERMAFLDLLKHRHRLFKK